MTAWLMLLPLMMLAGPITREQAMQKALEQLKDRPGSKKLTPVTNPRKLARSKVGVTTQELYYVFNRGDNGGYVLVAGDDGVEPLLGYTDEGEFDYNELPDNMKSWLEAQAAGVQYMLDNPSYAPKKVPTHPAIAQMMTTRWNQGSPYNNACPLHAGRRSVTGCVATAFAQVLYFQADKSVTETQADIPGYTTWTEKLVVPGIAAGAPIDWKNMIDSYGGTAIQQTAVANLMLYCGVSVEMDYTNSSSGAHTEQVPVAMNKYFGYSTARYVYKSSYTDDTWDALVYNELNEGRVVLLSGYNSSAGHAFVCDGYDGNHCYHINWGWGGSSDGHFLLNSLNPSSQGIGGSGDGYSDGLGAVIGALPDNYAEKEMPIATALVKRLCLANFDANGDGVFTYGEAAAVTDLGEVFTGQKFATFTELYYFTGLKEISDHAFEGNTTITAITLPKSIEKIGKKAFSGCTKLKTFKKYDNIAEIGEGAFSGCKALTEFELAPIVTVIADSTFAGCTSLTGFNLPVSVTSIGSRAFDGCTKLVSFTVNNITPQDIALGADVWNGIDLSKATLNVVQGTESYFETADQWKEFGKRHQERDLTGGKFSKLTTGKYVYLYNEGTARYMTKGEAWGTQAVVGDNPLRFQLKHTTSMPDGVYYLTTVDEASGNNTLFRTSTDGNVGRGVQACFVDGDDSHITDGSAYWKVEEVSDGVYTFQIPSGQSGYNASKYWGVQTNHASNAASPTYGAYSDVVYADFTKNCHWRFVEYDEAVYELYNEANILANLLKIADSRSTECTDEQAVYDDINSTADEIRQAAKTLRKKLGFISFKDPEVRRIAVTYFDSDGNGEITTSEASRVDYLSSYFYRNKTLKTLEDLKYFTGITTFYGNSFQECDNLETVYIPEGLTTMYYWAFKGCKSLTSVDLPNVTYIGPQVFGDCANLKAVSIQTSDPDKIDMGDDVFQNVDVKNATLTVPAGSKDLYAAADQWKEFGKIEEMRPQAKAAFSAIEPNVPGYIYNYEEEKYLSKGEAWGTQAIVETAGMQFQFKRTASMPEGQYYLQSDAGVTFRTSSDGTVGTGVKACFVDGSAGATAYWTVDSVAELTYTIQVPSNDATYTAGEYLGTNQSHESSYASPTFGAYWDVKPSESGKNIQWGFVRKADIDAASEYNASVKLLMELLDLAKEKDIETTAEQAVYDDYGSTLEEILEAVRSLKVKLGYIQFADSRVKTVSTNNWDDNDDGELTVDEAANVNTIGQKFRNFSAIKSFEELRYFTGLTELQDEAFRGCSGMVSLYVPENVKSIGEKAFTGCSALKYIALLSDELVKADGCAVSRSATIFVPETLVEVYQADETWGKCTIKPYTGVPVVTPDSASRTYGVQKTSFTFSVSGAPINGEPSISHETELTTPVGEYPLHCEIGNITTPGTVCQDGVLTVEPATLTITAKSYTREPGEENPEFAVTYRGWKNKETVEIMTSPVVIECDATIDSKPGVYEIRLSGAEAPNYEIAYVNGTLTINGHTDGDVNEDDKVDINDVVSIINIMAASGSVEDNPYANVNGDDKIDINDVVAVINIMATQ